MAEPDGRSKSYWVCERFGLRFSWLLTTGSAVRVRPPELKAANEKGSPKRGPFFVTRLRRAGGRDSLRARGRLWLTAVLGRAALRRGLRSSLPRTENSSGLEFSVNAVESVRRSIAAGWRPGGVGGRSTRSSPFAGAGPRSGGPFSLRAFGARGGRDSLRSLARRLLTALLAGALRRLRCSLPRL